jgi:hypothetical protein
MARDKVVDYETEIAVCPFCETRVEDMDGNHYVVDTWDVRVQNARTYWLMLICRAKAENIPPEKDGWVPTKEVMKYAFMLPKRAIYLAGEEGEPLIVPSPDSPQRDWTH